VRTNTFDHRVVQGTRAQNESQGMYNSKKGCKKEDFVDGDEIGGC